MEASALTEAIARGRDDINYFAQVFLDVYPHPGQQRWFENSTCKMNVLTPGNRYGKSVGTAVKHLHHGFYKYGEGWRRFYFGDGDITDEKWLAAPYATLNASVSADQAEIVYREAVQFCNRPRFRPFVKDVRVSPFPHIILQNGAIIHARSASDNGKYIDGHHYAYMSYDEAGWEKQLDWLLGTVLLPRLTDWGGNLDIIGTPKGRGDLYRLMMRGLSAGPNDDIYAQKGSMYENPYIDHAEVKKLEDELNAINPKLARQAIYGDFVDTDGLVFSWTQIQGNMLRGDDYEVERHLLADGAEYRTVGFEPDPSRRYVAAFDLARKTDRFVGVVLDTTVKPYVICRAIVLTGASWEAMYEHIRRFGSEHNCVPVIDSTGLGDVVDEELSKRGIAHKCFDFNDGRGIKKERLITNLQNGLDYGRPSEDGASDDDRQWGLLRCGIIPPLLEELSVYEMDDKKLATDCVMALAMAFWEAHRVTVETFNPVMAPMRPSRRRRYR